MLQMPVFPVGPVMVREILRLVGVELIIALEICEAVTFPWSGIVVIVPLLLVAVIVEMMFSVQSKLMIWSAVTFTKV